VNGELRIKNLALASCRACETIVTRIVRIRGINTDKENSSWLHRDFCFFRPKQVKIALIYLVGIHYFPSLLKICVICEICERLFAQALQPVPAHRKVNGKGEQ
jgi:hypothetical protein